MIHELRTLTVKAGLLADMLADSAAAREILSPHHGTMEGYWVADVGALNRVWHLWSYDDRNQRQATREALAKDTRWTQQQLPRSSSYMLQREARIMDPVAPLKAPEGTGNIYEYRHYRTSMAGVSKLAALMVEAASVRAGHVHDVGMWVTDTGHLDEFSHMIAYPSMAARDEQRAAMMADAEWLRFHKEITQLIEDAHSEILRPVDWSGLR